MQRQTAGDVNTLRAMISGAARGLDWPANADMSRPLKIAATAAPAVQAGKKKQAPKQMQWEKATAGSGGSSSIFSSEYIFGPSVAGSASFRSIAQVAKQKLVKKIPVPPPAPAKPSSAATVAAAPPSSPAALPPAAHQVEKPKRPLSAYNFFFQHERARLLLLAERGERLEDHPPVDLRQEDVRALLRAAAARNAAEQREAAAGSADGSSGRRGGARAHRKSHGKVGFTDLAKRMAVTWKSCDPRTRAIFEEVSDDDKARYRQEMRAYRVKMNALKATLGRVPPQLRDQKAGAAAKGKKKRAVPATPFAVSSTVLKKAKVELPKPEAARVSAANEAVKNLLSKKALRSAIGLGGLPSSKPSGLPALSGLPSLGSKAATIPALRPSATAAALSVTPLSAEELALELEPLPLPPPADAAKACAQKDGRLPHLYLSLLEEEARQNRAIMPSSLFSPVASGPSCIPSIQKPRFDSELFTFLDALDWHTL